MEPNRRYGDDIICGPFFICGDDGGEFISLTDEQVEQYALQFKEIPQFTGRELTVWSQTVTKKSHSLGGKNQSWNKE